MYCNLVVLYADIRTILNNKYDSNSFPAAHDLKRLHPVNIQFNRIEAGIPHNRRQISLDEVSCSHPFHEHPDVKQ